jgi:crotonobetainyl-CoA:carnitine CoA-transferase CaiB-like acyl-CoA transferase
VYRTQDGRWVSLAGSTNALFANNCRAIGRPDLIDDPRFASNGTRVQHAAELNALLRPWCAQRPLAEVLATPLTRPAALLPRSTTSPRSQPTRRCRRARPSATCPTPTSAACAWPPWCRALPRPRRHPPQRRRLGADNRAFYHRRAGLTEPELAALRAAGVI